MGCGASSPTAPATTMKTIQPTTTEAPEKTTTTATTEAPEKTTTTTAMDKKDVTKEDELEEIIKAGGQQSYTLAAAPEMIPIGFKKMVNDPTNHRPFLANNTNNTTTTTDTDETRIVVIGSGYHLAVALSPTPLGVTPDIKGDFDPNDSQGKIVFASIDEICTSINAATSVKIRKNPLDKEYEQAKAESDEAAVAFGYEEQKALQLKEYKMNLITWLKSSFCRSTPDDDNSSNSDTIKITFVRNVYPMNPDTNSFIEQSAKPVWCTGLNVDLCLDCGSGQCVLVDGVLGTQIFHSKTGESLKWNTEQGNEEKWTEEEIAVQVGNIRDIIKDNAGFDGDGNMDRKIVAYGTGNWRKEHMATIWPKLKEALMNQLSVEFDLLPGHLEAKYGGISSLKLCVPYALNVKNWVVVEMGSGSTQITRFQKK